jgi:Sulfotransferase domain/N-terminal domain of galactosyltransferase
MNPSIIFCTTCKGRSQHIKETLPRNLADNASYPDCKFVLLDYNDPGDLNEYLLSNHQQDINSGRLIVYSLLRPDTGPVPFRMAHAKNTAHRLGIIEGADILVNLDADNFTCKDFAKYISEEMHFGDRFLKDTYLWAKMKHGQFRRGISGRIVVSKRAFLNIGGYDEKYETWSPDDKDFNSRLGRLGYVAKEIAEQYLDAVNHNDKMRFKEYKHVKGQWYEDSFDISECEATVVNFGNIGCGTVFKNFDLSNPIYLDPIPTRIFGIGMHKTATTSLHEALQILGYDSEHWVSAHWAKAIWTEMKSECRSLTLENHYALCDIPITVLYKELDQAYPGSKFILTLRDDNSWLESVRRHWNPNFNKFRKEWDRDPFSHFIHKQIYGRRDFDAETMLATYRRHNAEVLEYFKSRPNDLLVFNSHGGWPKLCNFLKRPIPDVLYPMRNGSNI